MQSRARSTAAAAPAGASRASGPPDDFSAAPLTAPEKAALSEAMARQLEKALERNDGRGGVVLRVSQGGKPIFEGAAGFTDRTGKRRMAVDTPFDIASITKTFTAAMTLKLVEDGALSLDAPISRMLPASVVEDFNPKITVRQLLSHTSGLPDYWTDPPHDKDGDNAFLRKFNDDPDRRWRPEELLDYARELKTFAKPGRKFHYSDTNYVLLGLIIERLTGKPLERVFRDELFAPLKMGGTYFSHGTLHGPDPRQAHRFEGKEDLFGKPRQSADWAGGGLVSTTADLEKFFLALRSGAVFDDPATSRMLTDDWTPTGDEDVSYGLGVFGVDLGKRGSLWGHDGHGNSFAYYWPERDLLFTGTLNQTDNDWWPIVDKAIKTLS